MRLSCFDYNLPKSLIAQYPLRERDNSRLLVLKRSGLEHRYFYEIVDYLEPGDVLVLNDTKVFPARLIGMSEDSDTQIEFLLVHPVRDNNLESPDEIYTDLYKNNPAIWKALARPAKKAKEGSRWSFGQVMKAEVIRVLGNGGRVLYFEFEGNFFKVLEGIGQIPLPPYIKREVQDADRESYQTVYADSLGSCAAPTAGLHFTRELLKEISLKGVTITSITLHVGPGTFLSFRRDKIEDHHLWPEYYKIKDESAKIIDKAKGRIVATGTTTARALETAFYGPKEGLTNLFIYPGFKFRVVNALITNFHLPRSSPLMLVAAFAGLERVLGAYKEAIEEEYSFYSYGDSMLIL